MANTSGFNRPLDLITEREVVYNFVTRLMIGEDWTDPEYSNTIFSQNLHLKNILRQIAKYLPTSVYNNLQTLETTYAEVSSGDTSVHLNIYGTQLLLAISERTGQDLTDAFTFMQNTTYNGKSAMEYMMTTDVPYENDDIIRFYAIGDSIE